MVRVGKFSSVVRAEKPQRRAAHTSQNRTKLAPLMKSLNLLGKSLHFTADVSMQDCEHVDQSKFERVCQQMMGRVAQDQGAFA